MRGIAIATRVRGVAGAARAAAAWWAVDLLASDVPSGGARVALGKYEYGFNTAV